MQSNSLGTRLYRTLKERRVILIYLPLAIYWGLLFIGTSIPGDVLPKIFKLNDKIEHFTAYFILAFIFNLALYFQEKNVKWSRLSFIYTIVFMALYALVDELHQLFVPGRYCDALDWTADFLGILLAVSLVYFFIKNIRIVVPE